MVADRKGISTDDGAGDGGQVVLEEGLGRCAAEAVLKCEPVSVVCSAWAPGLVTAPNYGTNCVWPSPVACASYQLVLPRSFLESTASTTER